MSTPRPASARTSHFLRAFAALAWLSAGLAAPVLAQAPAPHPAAPGVQGPPPRALAAKAASSAVKAPKPQTRPLWTELTPAQRQALAPLGGTWDTISEAQKRKWIALSENYPKMAPAEQAKLHNGMSEWVALSPQQRTQARLNFGETKQLSPDDKKAKWEAYQALTPEQKRNLAAGAAKKPPATAAAVKPVPAEKLATVPPARDVVRTPRIASGAPQAEPAPATLLPVPAPPASN